MDLMDAKELKEKDLNIGSEDLTLEHNLDPIVGKGLSKSGLENTNGLEMKEVVEKLEKCEEQNGLNSEKITKLEKELELKLKEIINNSNLIKELEKKFDKCEQYMKSREQEVIEFNKNIREQKELFEELSSSRDRIESELKLSTDLKNELISQIKGLNEDNEMLRNGEKSISDEVMSGRKEFENQIKIEFKKITENFGSLQTKIDVMMSQILDLLEEMTKLKNKLSENEFKAMVKNKEFVNKLLKRELKENFGSLQDKTDIIMDQISDLCEDMTKLKKTNHKLLEYNSKFVNKIDRNRESEELLPGIETEVKTGIETNLKSIPNQDREDRTRSETTFRYKIQNFSQLNEFTRSSPIFVRNLPWYLMVGPNTTKIKHKLIKTFGVFLECNIKSEPSTWSCKARAEFRIISQKEGIENVSKRIQRIFYDRGYDWGFNNFMAWNDILNPEKGYIKDDAIILEVWLSADPPNGI